MILITGGTGLLGSHILLEHLKRGIKTRVISRQKSIPSTLIHLCKFYNIDPGKLESHVDWHKGDVTDLTSIQDAFADVETVYHCAALVSFDSRDYNKLFDINVNGTTNIVNLCLQHKINKLCYVSSTAALAKNADNSIVVEDGNWQREQDSTAYSKSKFLAEREVWRGQEEGLNTVTVNPCVIIGPGDWSQSSSSVFKAGWKGMKFFTKGSNAFVDVRDVCAIMLELVEQNVVGERFLVIGENLPFQTLFSHINGAFGKRAPSIKASKWQTGLAWRLEKVRTLFGGTRRITKEMAQNAHSHVSYSNEKVTARLGFKFTPIEDSVQFAAEFYKNYSV